MDTAAVSIVTSIVEEALGLPPGQVKEDDSMDTVQEWDSLGHLNILMALDQKFAGQAAKVPELAKANSVNKIVAVLQAHNVL